MLADVNRAGMAETVALIAAQGGVAVAEHLDVTQRVEVQALADTVVERYGHVDILVNSAGSAFRSPAEDFPEEKLDFILDLNLKGTYLCCQAFGKKMLAQGKGSIINLASIGSFIAYPWASAYLASKGGVLGITRGMALEWRDRGVRVNGIGPTLMDSPLTKNAAVTTSLTADWIKSRMLRPRLGKPRELIGAAIYLASDASELVTGVHTIIVRRRLPGGVMELRLERLGPDLDFATVIRWLKAPGDAVVQGEVILEVEGEKATEEIASPVDGVIVELVAAEGDELPVGALLALIEER